MASCVIKQILQGLCGLSPNNRYILSGKGWAGGQLMLPVEVSQGLHGECVGAKEQPLENVCCSTKYIHRGQSGII